MFSESYRSRIRDFGLDFVLRFRVLARGKLKGFFFFVYRIRATKAVPDEGPTDRLYGRGGLRAG